MSATQPVPSTSGRFNQQRNYGGGSRGRYEPPLVLPKTPLVLVIDLEATCWEGKPPKGQENEIIEIGWALLDVKANAVTRNGTVLIKPTKSTVSEFCTSLTTITPELLEAEGVTLAEGFEVLRNLDAANLSWASYGQYDLNMLKRQAHAFNLHYPLRGTHTNVKTLFKEKNPRHRGSYGMKTAYEATFKQPIVGTHHRGGDDALNIAKILGQLLQK